MDKDLDMKLYNSFLNGDTKAFDELYLKYKDKIKYFIFNIIKNYEKSEDIMQETFMYVLKNKVKQGYSFKYYIYLIAKSRAINYLNSEKRRTEITNMYLSKDEEKIDEDVLELITKQEEKEELLNAINLLDEKYKNVIYLVKIEEFSYQDTAQILGISDKKVKNLIYRGKKELRKILIKKGFENMNKAVKVGLIVLCITVLLSGIAYGAYVAYKKFETNSNVKMNPTFTSTIDENTINNLWIGTLDLAWKDLAEKIGKNKIEFDENIKIANELNSSKFSKEMLDENDYKINVERTKTNGYKIDTALNKELNFLEVFDNFSREGYKWTFGEGTEPIKYFGINNASPEEMNKNVEILFYNNISKSNLNSNDFAIKLKTKEGDEIILYRTDEQKSLDEYYEDVLNKTNSYKGRKEFKEDDELRIPYVKVNGMIFYDELYGKEIKDSKGLIVYDVTQNVNFSLNERGCNLSSKATMITEYLGTGEDTKLCYFQDKFVIFMKEANSQMPYFALKVDNSDILEKQGEEEKATLRDYTMMKDKDRYKVSPGEYKFFEDEKYEYYYPSQKTKYVNVTIKEDNGELLNMTAEEALKQGKIKIDLLDEYGVEYIKKEK